MQFGVHVSITGGIDKAVERALALECDTFQIFTRSSRRWAAKEINRTIKTKFIESCIQHNFTEIVVHMPYLPNLSSVENEIYQKSVKTLLNEIKRCYSLRIPYLVLHLGSHKGVGKEKGHQQLVNALEKAIQSEFNIQLLLENSSGYKNSIGSNFEDLGEILSKISDSSKIGICFDTCHAFAAGYDLRTESSVENTLENFDKYIGLNKIKIIHSNDSKGVINSKKDRHEHIGLGRIGENGFKQILKQFPKVPYILETPINERRDDTENLNYIRSLL